MKLSHLGVMGRTIVAMLIIGTIYFAAFVLPDLLRPSTLPNQPLRELRSTLNENLVAVSGISEFSETGPAASVSLEGLRGQLKRSQQELERITNEKPKGVEGHILESLQSILEQQRPLSEVFASRYDILAKPIAYNPTADLGLSLEDKNHQEELRLRATAAATALKDISGNTTLPADLKAHLLDTSDCLNKLEQYVADEQLGAAAAQRSRCNTAYPKLRKQAIAYVIEVFQPQNIRSKVADSISAIDKALIPEDS